MSYFSLFKLNILLALAYLVKSCQDGCLSCQYSLADSSEMCDLCMDGFTLQQNSECVKNVCEQYQFYDDQQSNQCLSLCNKNTVGLQNNQFCQQLSSCSNRYIQQSSISQQQTIQSVLYYIQNTIIAIFTSFFNIIDAETGAFIRSQTFNQDIILIRSYDKYVYMFSNSNQIFQWSSIENQMTLITTAQQGFINSQSDIIHVMNNKNRLFFSSFDHQGLEIIFNEIKQTDFNYITLKYDNQFTIIKGIIILQNKDYQLRLVNLIEKANQIIELNFITSQYSCADVQGIINQLEINMNTQTYFMAFQNTNAIVYFQQQNQQCYYQKENSQPLKIQLFYNNDSSSSVLNQFLIVSFSSNQFKIFNSVSLVSLFELQFQNQINDFYCFFENNQLGKIYFLLQSKIIDVYQITLDQQSDVITLKQIHSLQSLISKPSQLVTINQDLSSSFPQKIGVIGQDLQLIQVQQHTITGITVNYSEIANYNQGQINKLCYDEEIGLSISCSQDGKLVVWNQVDPLNPIFYYQIKFPNQSCIDAAIFQSRLVVSLFTYQIFIFNIFNQQISETITINSQQQSSISISSNYIFLSFNQQIQIMTDLSQISQIFQITQQVQTILYSSSNNIYIFDNANTITAYQFNNGSITLQKQVTPFQYQVPLIKAYLFDLDSQGKFLHKQFLIPIL